MSVIKLGDVSVEEVYDEAFGFSRLYTKDGDLLVLITADYGLGWSTFSPGHSNQLLMDARIIRFFYNTYLQNLRSRRVKDEEKPFLEFLQSLGIHDTLVTTIQPISKFLTIKCIPNGAQFKIHEYDGKESIIYKEDLFWRTKNWYTA
jgi:hypothetical protein